ncbi:MAG: MFS transporter [Sphaerochaetaceae bacterium]
MLSWLLGSSFTGSQLIWCIILLMALFSFSGAFANISYVDILGRVIAPQKRKKLMILKQLISSIGVVLSALIVRSVLEKVPYPDNYRLLFIFAAVLLFIAAGGFYLIKEPDDTKKVTLKEPLVKQFISIFTTNRDFRYYLLLMNTTSVVVSVFPFLMLFGGTRFTLLPSHTGMFLLVQMCSAVITNTILALTSKNRYYRPLMYAFIVLSAAIPIAALILPPKPMWYALVFVGSGAAFSLFEIVSQGVLIEISSEDNIALYTGLSGFGSVMQVLFPFLFGLLVPILGYTLVFIATSLYLLIGFISAKQISCAHLRL